VAIFRRKGTTDDASKDASTDVEGFESYQLLLTTLERSNILLWWARVTREGSDYQWKIRTPPKLHDNPIYKLAGERERGGLWNDAQAPDNERTKLFTIKALEEGLPGYQQEFRIIGADGVHWLSEEVLVRKAGANEWNLAGVVVDVTKRLEAEDSRKQTEGQIEKILKGADCLLWQAYVTGPANKVQEWKMFVPQSILYKRIFGKDSLYGQTTLWTEDMIPEWDMINKASRRAMIEGKSEYDQEFHVVVRGKTFCVHEHVSIDKLGPEKWNLVGVIIDITQLKETGAFEGARRGAGILPHQERVPGEHEPRDTHADERRDRDDGPPHGYRACAHSAGIRGDDPQLGGFAAHDHQ
jgi:hypothetical protein